MSKETAISWADSTLNFWHGCEKVSDGCKFCYMYRDKIKYGQDPKIVVRARKELWAQLSKWKEGRVIFVCSWSDFNIKKADPWRQEAWDRMRENPQHIYIILTKRPERYLECLPPDWGNGWPNVILGVSVENPKTAKFRIMKLFEVKAQTRMVSAEPLLRPIDLRPYLKVMLANTNTAPVKESGYTIL